MDKATFETQNPGVFFLDPGDLEGTSHYLRGRGWLAPDEQLLAQDKAGEGNMNCTLRLRTSTRSLICKQARPWVEKYPQIPAPWDRAIQEARFYELVQGQETITQSMPGLLGVDEEARILLLDDLGKGSDLLTLYQPGEQLSQQQSTRLVTFLAALHQQTFTVAQREQLTNRQMRLLNHEHIFSLPLAPHNGIDLDAFSPGLQEIAQPLKEDTAYTQKVHELGQLYLSDGTSLLHGDFYPGSWLQKGEALYVLDPEFGFFGTPAFDVGVCVGHMVLAAQPATQIKAMLADYQTQAPLDLALALRFAGVEMMRRLIGVAQLPLNADTKTRSHWLSLSQKLVLRPSLDGLEAA